MTTGLLVMAYGTPAGPDDVEAYYTHIRRGRPPEPAQLADLVGRYDAIGGVSPLRRRTEEQAAAVHARLGTDGGEWVLALGMKHAPPFIEDAVTTLADAGVDRVVALALAPHYSGGSVGEYLARAQSAADAAELELRAVERWHLEPELIAFHADAVGVARRTVPERHKVLFTAHSLPLRVLDGDGYADEVAATAEAVAAAADLGRFADWGVCWQSAGRTPDPWLGPDIADVVADLAGTGRAEGVVVCPIGFVSDHLEIRYDLDIAARRAAEDAGLGFARAATVDADPGVMAALARRVEEAARG